MITAKIKWWLGIRVLLLLISLTALSYVLIRGWLLPPVLIVPLIIYQVIAFYRAQLRTYEELSQFMGAVRYRDFTRHYHDKQGPPDLKYLRKGLNDINSAFKIISREKETQYQYLQNILELVDTGILSYQEENEEVVWINEPFKKMFQLPYLKNLHTLIHRNDVLYQAIVALKPGESKVGTIAVDNNTFKFLFSAAVFQTAGRKYKLVAIKNINEALDESESQAWQKLLSVLTHEIMNSIAPISSLADTLKHLLKAEESNTVPREDIELGIDTIKRRSEGLLKFAEVYRSLNKVSRPSLKNIYIRDLFENLHHLMQPTLHQKNIEMDVVLKEPGLALKADPVLLEQVLINLIVNAVDAVKDQKEPRICLSAAAGNDSKTIIKVADNGAGIPPDVLDRIFVPFFSTKKSGSGIGLTLCKQIIMMHHGNIQVQSAENKGTAFVIQL